MAQDADNDAIPDAADAFPCDPSASGERYAPAEGVHGTVAFEDQWPSDGDLDFNDVVVTYNYAARTVGNGLVSQLRATFNVRAAGGGNSNGLGLHLPVPRTAIGFVTRRVGNGATESVTRSPTDTEADIVVVPNIRALFGDADGPINSRGDLPARAGVPVEVNITFFTPTTINFAAAPFDLYIFRVGTPSLEIHRPGFRGTSRMNAALFNTQSDASNGVTNFVNRSGLPFALLVPDGWAWPREATSIDQAYPQVVGFASSGGFSNLGWYTTFNAPSVYGAPSGSHLAAATFVTGARWPVDRACLCRVSQARVFTYTGAPEWFFVPLGVTRVDVKAWGAAGGGSNAEGRQFPGGPGAFVSGSLAVTPGQALQVVVGRGGRLSTSGAVSAYPGGGAPGTRVGYVMGGGGGRSAILDDFGQDALVAGGGGGAGGTGWSSPLSTAGGPGGGPNGGDGSYATDGTDRSACRGRGATQSEGGAGGSCGPTGGYGFSHGGGDGRDFAAGGNAGGGGGDGYYGGGAGAMHAGGGGGSSWATWWVTSPVFSMSATGALPPGTADVDYVTGVGAGAAGAVGGDGRVVLRFEGPCACTQQLAAFAATGAAQTFTVPAGVEMVRATLWGAGGGGSNAEGRQFPGGPGGFASGVVDVTPGETLTVVVGNGGGRTSVAGAASAYPNGGRAGQRAGYSMGNGGGRSALVRAGTELLVAGGGGGAGGTGWNSPLSTRGGGGGGVAGGDGSYATDGTDRSACRGRGATQSGGGAGGNCGAYGGAGARNAGGDGLDYGAGGNAGGGGGDGYWGGGAGGMHAGGGGGAGFFHASVLDGFLASPSLTSVAPSIAEPGYPGGRVGEGAADMDGGPGAVVLWSYVPGACP